MKAARKDIDGIGLQSFLSTKLHGHGSNLMIKVWTFLLDSHDQSIDNLLLLKDMSLSHERMPPQMIFLDGRGFVLLKFWSGWAAQGYMSLVVLAR